ncbi:hypothetical protein [Tenacibaculum agarivorans]|uniref:hypothetical protein n=1 Tax=Tenacibaculum agarivorans TaxID=1908389 RepID=UPI00094BBE91|nr:hypothetical protein [Tenacibaculum agarivorans]
MRKLIHTSLYLFLFSLNAQIKKETIFLNFESYIKEKCLIEDGSGSKMQILKYRKEMSKKRTLFKICDEQFTLNNKVKIDTCNLDYLKKIKFSTIEEMNKKWDNNRKEDLFSSSAYEQIFILEKNNNKIIKYPVIWSSSYTEK